MKNALRIIAAALSIGVVPASFALTWTDTSTFSPQYLYISGNASTSYRTGTFDITDNGFNPGTHLLTSAVAKFAFSDGQSSDSDSEYVDILLDLTLFINDREVDGTHQNIPTSYDWVSGAVTGSLLVSLQTDGKLDWKVQLLNVSNNDDNTWLKVAELTAYGENRPPGNTPGVPDGGSTLALFSFGLMGLVALRKRFL